MSLACSNSHLKLMIHFRLKLSKIIKISSRFATSFEHFQEALFTFFSPAVDSSVKVSIFT